MLARFRSGSTRPRLVLGALLFALLLVVPSSASAHNGLPDDLTGYAWVGEVGLGWTHTYDQSDFGGNREEENGEMFLRQLQPRQNSADGSYAAQVLEPTLFNRKTYTDLCGPLSLYSDEGLSYTGRSFTEGVPDLTLLSRPDGFYMLPKSYFYLKDGTGTSYGCNGEVYPDVGPPDVALVPIPGQNPTNLAKLQQDIDPDPYHLVGQSTWGLGNSPWALYSPITSYGLAVTYDLRLVPTGDFTECTDGLDNDGDGRTDFPSDPGCTDASDVSELGSAECDNGIDDDGNGKVDFRSNGQGDPNCQSLTDEREAHPDSCIDRFYTVADGKSSLRLTVLPDPDIGSASLGVAWCTTENGAAIQSVPGQYLFLTDKWIFLGALESSGFKPVARSLKISQIKSSVSATGQVGLKFSLGEVAASLFPYGRALKAIDKATKKLKKLNRAGKLSAQAVQKYRKLVRRHMDELEDKLEKGLAKKLDRIPLVGSGTANQFADGITDVLEEVTSHFEKKLFASIPSRASGPIFKQLFKDVTVSLWEPNISLSFSNNGSYQFRDGSSVMIPGMIKNEWKHGHK